jgi:hypothetical protein
MVGYRGGGGNTLEFHCVSLCQFVSVCVGRRRADAQTPAHEEIIRNGGREWTYNMMAVQRMLVYFK